MDDSLPEEDHCDEKEKEGSGSKFHCSSVPFLEFDEGVAGHAPISENEDDHKWADESEVVVEEIPHGIHGPLLNLEYNRGINLSGTGEFKKRDDQAAEEGGDDEAS